MMKALKFDKIKAFLEIFLVFIELVSTKIILEWEEGKNRMAKCRLNKANVSYRPLPRKKT